MASLKTVKLKDNKSNLFLTSKGFQNLSHIGNKSKWVLAGSCLLYFDVDDVIHTDVDLCRLLYEKTYKLGREQGKQDALELVLDNFSNIIFSNQSTTDEY